MFDFAVVKVSLLEAKAGQEAKFDKNTLQSVILEPVGGKMPNNRVLSGTIAERQLFEVGKCYMVAIEQLPDDEKYGEQFRFNNLGLLSGIELMRTCKELGKGVVVKPATSTSTTPELMVQNGQMVA